MSKTRPITPDLIRRCVDEIEGYGFLREGQDGYAALQVLRRSADALAELQANDETTNAVPTLEGYYWWRKYPNRNWEVVHVIRSTCGDLMFNGWSLQRQGGEWGGRIQEPKNGGR